MTLRMAAVGTRRPARSRFQKLLLAALLATIAMYALGLGFIYLGGVFAPLSDLGAMTVALLMLAVAETLFAEVEPSAPGLNRWTRTLGRVSYGVSAACSGALVVLDKAGLEKLSDVTLKGQLGAGLGQGAWFLALSALIRRTARWDGLAATAAAVAGGGYLVGSLRALVGDLQSPLFTLSFVASLAGFIVLATRMRGVTQ